MAGGTTVNVADVPDDNGTPCVGICTKVTTNVNTIFFFFIENEIFLNKHVIFVVNLVLVFPVDKRIIKPIEEVKNAA